MRSRLVAVAAYALALACLAAVLLSITPRYTAYDGPLRMACELVRGRTYLPEFVEWLEMFRHDGRDYLAYPPMVSFVLVPYAALSGSSLGQPLANTILILGSAVLLFALMRRLPGVEPLAGRAALAYALGTPVLYSASAGDVWMLMHSEGNFFLLLALLLVVRTRCGAGSGGGRAALLGAGFCFLVAMQVRYSVALASLTFGLLFLQRAPRGARLSAALRSSLWFGAGALPALVVVLAYQWWTLGDPLMLPYSAGWREWGLRGPQFSLRYFWRNLPVYTWAVPSLLPGFPYLRFDASGQSIFVLSPFFLGVFLADVRRPWVPAFLAAAVAMFGLYLLYFGTGFAQFGARYVQDAYPVLLPAAFSAFGRPGRGWRAALDALIVFSVAFNSYGVYVTRFLPG